MNKDYYKILGINKDATESEIKEAYRKLAGLYHPDVSNDPNANEKMAEINEAYSILKDPSKRANYDEYGNVQNEEYNYNPNNTYYEYNSGYVFIKRPSFIFRIIVRIILFIFLLEIGANLITNYMKKGNMTSDDYNFNYMKKSETELVISGIKQKTFYDNFRDIKELVIPSFYESGNVKYSIIGISSESFAYYNSLTTLTIYSNIEYIGDYAFYNCSNLKTIYFYGTEEEFDQIKIGKGNSVITKDKVIFKGESF